MDRRTFLGVLAGGLFAAPLAAGAQQDRIARIGFLDQFSGPLPNLLSAFRESMRELGYVGLLTTACIAHGARVAWKSRCSGRILAIWSLLADLARGLGLRVTRGPPPPALPYRGRPSPAVPPNLRGATPPLEP
jgi:hypothetical protein